MKRTIRLLAALTLMATGLAAFAVGPSGADEAASITKLGWWTRNPAAQAPDDGFDVQHAPDGPVSVAAIEVSGFDPLRSAALILREAGGVGQENAALQVCSSPNVWSTGAAQPWADAPKPECEQASVDLVRNNAAATWSADVLSLLGDIDDGPVTLMVVPAGGTIPAFDVQFAAPQLQAEADPDAGGPAFDFGGSDFGGSSGDSSGSFGGGGSFDDTGSSGAGSFGGTSFEPADSTFTPAGDIAADGAGEDTSEAEPSTASDEADVAFPLPRSSAQATAAEGGNRAVQSAFFLVISTVAAVGAAAGRRWMRERQPEGMA